MTGNRGTAGPDQLTRSEPDARAAGGPPAVHPDEEVNHVPVYAFECAPAGPSS